MKRKSDKIRGYLIKYAEKNINTDLIIPARYLIDSDPDRLAIHCMEDLDPEFIKKKEELRAKIFVADSNFGCGSSREQAPIAIKAAGIECVLAPSFARIFFRNSINIGLAIIEFKEIDEIHTGDELEINFKTGVIKNLNSTKEYAIQKMPFFLQELISAGGLVNYTRQNFLKK